MGGSRDRVENGGVFVTLNVDGREATLASDARERVVDEFDGTGDRALMVAIVALPGSTGVV